MNRHGTIRLIYSSTGHDELVHDVVLPLRRGVLTHVETEDRAGLGARGKLDFAGPHFFADKLLEFFRADFAQTFEARNLRLPAEFYPKTAACWHPKAVTRFRDSEGNHAYYEISRNLGIGEKGTSMDPKLSFGLERHLILGAIFSLTATSLTALAATAKPLPEATENASPKAIPWAEVGTSARAQYSGNGLKIIPTEHGARLHCVFQRLEGEATHEGLWLTSTASNSMNDRFRVMSIAVGREEATMPLPPTGKVIIAGERVRYIRPGLVEEYTVSMDGVRQDFVVLEKPDGASVPASRLASSLAPPTEAELRVVLAVTGARAEPIASGAQLVLDKSGRKIAYSRLQVTDANGKELPARIELANASKSEIQNPESKMALAVVVNDSDAVYPVRIDPTFSDANWISISPSISGADAVVYEAVADSSGNLYIGGEFTVIGDVVANRIAKWDGNSWSALGSGMNNWVLALAVSGNNLFAAGSFTNAGGIVANRIAKWDGNSWSALGSGLNNSVYALAATDNNLYAGGRFTNAGGVAANCIAMWNGSEWSALSSGMSDDYPQVTALATLGEEVYAGGQFTNAGGVPATSIAKWNGTSWSALGLGMAALPGTNPDVQALHVSGTDVYAAGYFTMLTNNNGVSISANNIAKWNGTSWSGLGGGIGGGGVWTVATIANEVYVGGSFTWATNTGGAAVSAKYVAKWDGNAWSPLGAGPDVSVDTLVFLGNDLFAGGRFDTAGGRVAKRIAKWNGADWSGLASGINGSVSALAVSDTAVYAGGTFTEVGGESVHRITKWNGSSWSELGVGMNNVVHALATSGNDLYAGGSFTMVTNSGGVVVTANRIAKWNGNTWSALGSGMNSLVQALAVSGSNLYAGGSFTLVTNSGGASITANRIAKWNGNAWSAMGLGVNNAVQALAVGDTNLFVGGQFTVATNTGGTLVTVNRVARWDGSIWSALGSGTGSAGQGRGVMALAVSGTNLYAGGEFFTPGNYVAKWNGSSWSGLGIGMSGGGIPYVSALAASGSDLYAGGNFTRAGGLPASCIAKWNGNSWSALGSGMGGGFNASTPVVLALLVSSSNLYVGGHFTTAGGKVSAYIAQAVLGDAPGYNRLNGQLSSGGTMRFSYIGYPATNYALDRTLSLSLPVSWVGQQTNTMTVSGVLMFTNTPVIGANNFWRVRSVP